jgi:thymidylate synthase (FAD)
MQTAELLTRPSVPAMDALLGYAHPVLDHGFVRLIDYMGDEPAVLQAARVSYGKGTKQSSEDRGLLRYLMRHRHTTPFEMAEIKLHVKLPVFVARQWIRHRTANVNEYSARYSILEREFYVPKLEDILQQSTTNKQGRGGDLTEKDRLYIQNQMQLSADRDFDLYEMLTHDEDDGEDQGLNVARELARINLPLSTYTEWYWKVDLHNLLHFLSLRADPHAQKEIRDYADVMLKIVRQWVPNIYDAFTDYRIDARSFSGPEMAILRRALAANPGAMAQVERALSLDLELSNREKDAFVASLRGVVSHA